MLQLANIGDYGVQSWLDSQDNHEEVVMGKVDHDYSH